ncbi:PDZ domain-containing protein [Neobacillus notoginsengisoli]|uniref:PDZ domain-containing protein n=1 Tax=Neobacillus notoginsengisoli TaxID=1578198 RepID=A0A417YTL6_9BACI|nr:trypsin-like peptidase domain-containing protein [Neobacillus notoginsengisoli]RHW40404.1 PDZ domain-containing protein [Neobacillus notoginsengisoli]
MGYYDQDVQTRYREPEPKKSKKGTFFASLLGAIIGAFLVIFTIPYLSNAGLLPYKVEPTNKAEETTAVGGKITSDGQKKIAVDVETDVTKAVDKAADAVVGISNIQASKGFWFSEEQERAAGTGSGVIYKVKGNKAYIATNAHVVDGATELEVTLSNGSKIPGKLKGSDVWTDLAVVEVDSKVIKTVAEFGDSDNLKPGEPVIAIGNPLGLTFSGSVTKGIISGLERSIPVDINQDGIADWQAEVIQTDAAINPGNSGGALINIAGQVIGINSMKIAQNAVEGIGLSIPINYAEPVIDDLEKYGEVRRPYMGVDLRSVAELPASFQQSELQLPKSVNYGVALRHIVPNSPAEKAGLKELDVIVSMDGEKIEDAIDLRKHLYNKKKIGEEMKITYYREGKQMKTTLVLGEGDI